MTTQDLTPLTQVHDENSAKGKGLKPYQVAVVRTPEEETKQAKMKAEDRMTDFRALQKARGVWTR